MTMLTQPDTGSLALRGLLEQPRLLAAGTEARLSGHVDSFGALPAAQSSDRLQHELALSGLLGRGGAGFPVGEKIAAVQRMAARRGRHSAPVVIGNGAEGEPLGFKDRVLLRHAPHLVIDGLVLAARLVGAEQLHLYLRAESLAWVRRALAERPEAAAIQLAQAPGTFVSGQSSAVVSALSSGPAVPRDLVRHLSESGLGGRPTLVLNVETLAHVALVARYGAAWFREAGTAGAPGSRMLTLVYRGTNRVVEVHDGAHLGLVLEQQEIPLAQVQAVLVGGFHGRWTSGLDQRLEPGARPGNGLSPGAGILEVLEQGACGLSRTAQILDYLARSSAKQCGPCMNGLPVLARAMAALARGERDPGLLARVLDLAQTVTGRGACSHPDGTARCAASALEVFADDLRAHQAGYCLHTREARP